ncbi:MAG TPA: phage holin family protein [Thermoanaerobaculia bacterium]|nr:phage holin family protein [Thermoanaerobaculia bacterium]
MNLIIRWILNTLALFAVAYVLPGFHYKNWIAVAIAAAVLGILNALVRPILYVLTLPITVLTLGLFVFVLNAIMLKLTAALVPGFDIDGWLWAIIGAVVLAAVSTVTNHFKPSEEDKR